MKKLKKKLRKQAAIRKNASKQTKLMLTWLDSMDD